MNINQDPSNWNDVILDIGSRTIDEIVKYGPSLVIFGMTRQQTVINRIWCKALVRYLMRNKEWMSDNENVVKLKLLSNFTQSLRREVSTRSYGNQTRANSMYKRIIIRLVHGAVGGSNLGWTDPYRLLTSIIFDNNLICHVLGTDNFKYREQAIEALNKLDVKSQ